MVVNNPPCFFANFYTKLSYKKMQLSKKSILILSIFFVVFVALCVFVVREESKYKNLEFIALDVGQGDAILIKTPYKQNILIDGGPDKSVVRAIDRHLPFWRRRIDLLVLTHPDTDHVTGLVEVLHRYPVARVMGTGVVHTLPAYIEWLEIIRDQNIPMDIVRASMRVELGENLWLDILWPVSDFVGANVEDNNETSIVCKLIYGDTSFLLTGDATIEVEKELLSHSTFTDLQFGSTAPAASGVWSQRLKSDVLKVGHHGSKGSTSMDFLRAVKPKYAVISVGENRFGHPTLRVLKNLENVGVVILRTDEQGDVILASDGRNVYYVQ